MKSVIKQPVIEIDPVVSAKLTTEDLLLALLASAGCTVGGISNIGEGQTYSDQWEWFNPSLVNEDNMDSLPEHWRNILERQNDECWDIEYCYVHTPEPILCNYPRIPLKGIFGVGGDIIPEKVRGSDLIHLDGQFLEYDTDKNPNFLSWIKN